MPYHITKSGSILDPNKVIYYKGDQRWTDVYEDRKVFSRKTDATQSLYEYGGRVVSE